MYLLNNNHSTELLRERQELLAREAQDSRLAQELRAARRESDRDVGADERSVFQGVGFVAAGRGEALRDEK